MGPAPEVPPVAKSAWAVVACPEKLLEINRLERLTISESYFGFLLESINKLKFLNSLYIHIKDLLFKEHQFKNFIKGIYELKFLSEVDISFREFEKYDGY